MKERLVGIVAGLLVIAGLSACAEDAENAALDSTSPATVSAEELGAGEHGEAVEVEVAGPSQVVFRRITLPPGTGTGKHCHAGQLIAVVEQGVFTHHAPTYPTGVHVYSAGDSIIEGAGYVHEGINEGDEDVVLLVTYVIPEGEPLAQTDLAQCDS